MKMKKTLSKTLLSVLSITFLLAACGGNNTNNSTGSTNTPQSSSAAEETDTKKYQIEFLKHGSALPAENENVMKQQFDEALNIDLKMTITPSPEDRNNQLSVRIAAGNPPDVLWLESTTLQKFVKQDVLLDLTPYLDNELKPVVDYIGEESLKKGTVDGKVYALPSKDYLPQTSYWIRKDWLDGLNLQVPTTHDELFEVAKAFRENDPDKNGKKDTYGITGLQFETLSALYTGYDVAKPTDIYVKDGKVISSVMDPAMEDALKAIQRFIEADVVDPDFATATGLQNQQKAIQGKAGIVYATWPAMKKDEFVSQFTAVDPNADWVQFQSPAGPAGSYDNTLDIAGANILNGLPKQLGDDPGKLKRVFELLNYTVSEEGQKLTQFGLDGVHHTMQDGNVVLDEKLATEGAYFYQYQFFGRNDYDYLKARFPNQIEYIEFAKAQPRKEVINSAAHAPEGYNKADADKYINEEILKFMFNKRPLSEYQDFLNTLNSTFNYQVYIEAANEQAKAAGYLQ